MKSSPFQDDIRQNGGAVAWTAIAVGLWLVGCLIYCLLTIGCVSGNKADVSVFPKSNKSTAAENIEAGGKVAAGALDRVGKLFNKQ